MSIQQALVVVKIMMEEVWGGSQEYMDTRDECIEILVRAGMGEVEAEEMVEK